MTIDIASGLTSVLEAKKRLFPQHVNRISSLDDPCLRRLYYRRHDWDKAEPVPTSLQGVFETGNLLEPVINRIVSEVGMASTPRWRIVGNQMPTNDALLRQYQISGSIDGLLQVETVVREQITAECAREWTEWLTTGVVDIKTMSANVYPLLNCYDDLSRFPWTRGYRGQLQMYALAHGLEQCFILAVCKNNLYDMKFIEFKLDMAYLEGLLQKAEAVNTAIDLEYPPAGVADPDVCKRCAWLSFCAPPLHTTGNLEIRDDANLEEVLTRMEQLRECEKEYRDLEKVRDEILIKGQDIVVGPFMVTWKKTYGGQFRKTIVRMGS